MRKILSLLVAGLLLVGIAPPAAAYSPDTHHLAGKPISGYGFPQYGTPSSCHGTIYGRVDGHMVLFAPLHCLKNYGDPGSVVVGPDGHRIGITGPHYIGNAVNTATDLSWVWLDDGNWPAANLNKVYVGDTAKYNYREAPSGDVTCSDLDGRSDLLKTGYWTTKSDGYGPWNGSVSSIDYAGVGCDIHTTYSLFLGPANIPSGAPLWDQTYGEFIGEAKGWYSNQQLISYSHWRSPIRNLRDYYGHDDTFFCANSSCVNT